MWINEWEGSEEELTEIAETCVMNFVQDCEIDESDEILAKLFLEALSRSDVQSIVRGKMEDIYRAYKEAPHRLTRRGEDGGAYFYRCFDGKPCKGECEAKDCNMLDIVCEKLATYEDNEEKIKEQENADNR